MNSGLSGLPHKNFPLTIAQFTVDAAPDTASDYVLGYKASTGKFTKVLIDDLPNSGGSTLDVTDGVTTVTDASAISFTSGATITDNAGVAEVAITPGGFAHSYVGYNTAGGSTETMTRYRQYMKKVTLSSNGMIMNVGAYIKPSLSANVMGFVVAVLSDNAGTPDEIISLTPWTNVYFAVLDNSYRWVSIPVNVWCTAGDYWLAVMDVGSGSRLHIAYDGSGADKYYAVGNPWLSGADGGYSATATTNRYSIRASVIS